MSPAEVRQLRVPDEIASLDFQARLTQRRVPARLAPTPASLLKKTLAPWTVLPSITKGLSSKKPSLHRLLVNGIAMLLEAIAFGTGTRANTFF